MTTFRYHRGWTNKVSRELPAGEAILQPRYSRAWLRDDGSTERNELYDRGELVRVDYHDAGDPQALAAQHDSLYPGVLRMVHRTLDRAGEYTWSSIEAVDHCGKSNGHSIVLTDRVGRELVSIETDERGNMLRIEKTSWQRRDGDDDLKYVFEYDRTGQLKLVTDLEYGDSTPFDDIKGVLDDAAFYETGFALPRGIAGTPIPSPKRG
jgi:hypothetical protein